MLDFILSRQSQLLSGYIFCTFETQNCSDCCSVLFELFQIAMQAFLMLVCLVRVLIGVAYNFFPFCATAPF